MVSACRIASALCAAGVCPGSRVGLSLGRTPELLAAMLGILKAGCAYVPLLSTLPEKRKILLREILADIGKAVKRVTTPSSGRNDASRE